jgi:transposase
MLSFLGETPIFLVSGATDLRLGFRGLPAIVQNVLKRNPLSGVYLFCNGRRNRLKLLFFHRGGYWVCAKRLERGTFSWPDSETASVKMTPEELALLLSGIDVSGSRQRAWYRRVGNE